MKISADILVTVFNEEVSLPIKEIGFHRVEFNQFDGYLHQLFTKSLHCDMDHLKSLRESTALLSRIMLERKRLEDAERTPVSWRVKDED